MKRSCKCGSSRPCGMVGCEVYKSPFDGVTKEAEKIKLEWDKPTETAVSKVLDAGNFLSGTGVVIRTLSGDEFRFRYDEGSESIVINKISDRDGRITIQGGAGQNQILIK